MNTSSNAVKAIIRSLAPFVYSFIASVIAHFGYHVSLAVTIQIAAIAGLGLTVVLHALETQFPWVGAFLGWIGAPAYAPSTKALLIAHNQTLKSQIATLLAQQTPVAPVVVATPVVTAPVVTAPPVPIIQPVPVATPVEPSPFAPPPA